MFDRSWYNRSGVERVMGFASEDQVEQFFNDVPEFERMIVRSGIRLIKYWFSITDEEQQLRFLMRIHDPAQTVETLADGSGIACPLGRLHQGEEETFERTNIRRPPGSLSKATTRNRRG